MLDFMYDFEAIDRSSSPSTWDDSSQIGLFSASREQDDTDVHLDWGVGHQLVETFATTPSGRFFDLTPLRHAY